MKPNQQPQSSYVNTEKDQKDAYLAKLKHDYEVIFNTSEGKRVLEDLSKSCYKHQTSFDLDSKQMAYNEGKRTVFLHIVEMSTPEKEDENKPKEAKT